MESLQELLSRVAGASCRLIEVKQMVCDWGWSGELVRTVFVFTNRATADVDGVVFSFKNFGWMVVEAKRVGGTVGYDVLVVGDAVRVLEFRGDIVRKSLVTNAGLTELNRSRGDSNGIKLHLGNQGLCGTKTVTSNLQWVMRVYFSESHHFWQHVGPDSFCCGIKPLVDSAVAVRKGGIWRFSVAQVGNPVLDIWRAAEGNVDRRVWGKVAYKPLSVICNTTVYYICGYKAAQISLVGVRHVGIPSTVSNLGKM